MATDLSEYSDWKTIPNEDRSVQERPVIGEGS